MVRISRDADGSRVQDCLRLARNLEGAFNETGLETMAASLPTERTFVAVDDGELLGFASVAGHSPQVAELSWLAVADDHQGQGIGTRLLQELSADRASVGVRLLTVKTLADTVASETYEQTRRFYETEGFLHIETIDPYPEWEPGNPCAIYVKALSDGEC
jgi:GNAT superfamily N-acetyltransferase